MFVHLISTIDLSNQGMKSDEMVRIGHQCRKLGSSSLLFRNYLDKRHERLSLPVNFLNLRTVSVASSHDVVYLLSGYFNAFQSLAWTEIFKPFSTSGKISFLLFIIFEQLLAPQQGSPCTVCRSHFSWYYCNSSTTLDVQHFSLSS